ncbi:MAG: hypothetical protein BAJALOKI2v1_90068 [Promethearchaeota archaeon]|nr:MAG: hypothetical protein BAJALOKI2v1_90068 [Candidatus Lokiarchaeota archaeon]
MITLLSIEPKYRISLFNSFFFLKVRKLFENSHSKKEKERLESVANLSA